MNIQKIVEFVNNAEWKKHPYIEGVECSSLGDVKYKGKYCKGCLCRNGVNRKRTLLYRRVAINGQSYAVHRLIWESFNNSKIPEGYAIDHINTLSWDNRIDNLRCVTQEENNKNPLTIQHLKEREGIPVVRIDKKTNEIVGFYISVNEAQRKTGVNGRTIRRHLSGKKPCGKYRWEKAKYKYSCKWGKWWISGDL